MVTQPVLCGVAIDEKTTPSAGESVVSCWSVAVQSLRCVSAPLSPLLLLCETALFKTAVGAILAQGPCIGVHLGLRVGFDPQRKFCFSDE